MLITLLGESLVTRYVNSVTAVTEKLTQGRAMQTSVARKVQCIVSHEIHHVFLFWSFGKGRKLLITLLGELLVTRHVHSVTAVTEQLTQARAGQTSVARIVQCIISHEIHVTLLWSFGIDRKQSI